MQKTKSVFLLTFLVCFSTTVFGQVPSRQVPSLLGPQYQCPRSMTKDFLGSVFSWHALTAVQQEYCNISPYPEVEAAFSRTLESCSQVIGIPADESWAFYNTLVKTIREKMLRGEMRGTPDCGEVRQATIQEKAKILR